MSSGFDPVPSDRLEVTKEAGAALIDFDYRVAASLLKLTKALRLPKDTLGYLVDYLSLNQPMIPVSQLSGFTGFLAKNVFTATQEGTNSTAFTDLATVGPQLTGLPNGQYILFYGAVGSIALASTAARMSVQVNSDAAGEADTMYFRDTAGLNSMTARAKTLSSSDNNTVTAKYRTGDAAVTATFFDRWLIALKTGDL